MEPILIGNQQRLVGGDEAVDRICDSLPFSTTHTQSKQHTQVRDGTTPLLDYRPVDSLLRGGEKRAPLPSWSSFSRATTTIPSFFLSFLLTNMLSTGNKL